MKEWKALQYNTKSNLIVISLLTFACILGIDIHTPSLPSMVQFFGSSIDELQLAVPIFILGAAIGIVIWGPVSDRLGRKKTLTISTLVVIVSAAVATFSTNSEVFLCLRWLQGFGSGASMCLGRVIAADMLSKHDLAIIGPLTGLITGIAPMVAPIIGGYIETSIGWQGCFIFYSLLATLALIIFLISFYETAPETQKTQGVIHQYLQIFNSSRFLILIALLGTVLSIVNSYAIIAPFMVQVEMGFSPIFFGWLSGYCAVCQLIAKLFAPKLIRKYSTRRIQHFAWRLLTLSGFILVSRLLLSSYTHLPIIDSEALVITVDTLIFITGLGIAFCTMHLIIPFLISEALASTHHNKGINGAAFTAGGMLISFIITSLLALLPYEGSGTLGFFYLFLGITGMTASQAYTSIQKD